MAHQFTSSYVKDSVDLFRYYKKLGERAMAQCSDEGLFTTIDVESNSIAIIVKHMAGNMRSRWTDFLTSDGEKPDRNRDTEFEDAPKTRAALMEFWERGWKYLFDALEPLTDAFGAHGDDSNGAEFGDAGDQPADRALCASCWANRVFGKTSDREGHGEVGFAERAAWAVETIRRRRCGGAQVAALSPNEGNDKRILRGLLQSKLRGSL